MSPSKPASGACSASTLYFILYTLYFILHTGERRVQREHVLRSDAGGLGALLREAAALGHPTLYLCFLPYTYTLYFILILYKAAALGQLELVSALLDAGVSPFESDAEASTCVKYKV